MGKILLLYSIVLYVVTTYAEAACSCTVNTTCKPSGYLQGVEGDCVSLNNSDCCVSGQKYTTYKCSPTVTNATPAILTINGFDAGEDGGSESSCDGKYHKNTEFITALSTGWFNGGSRCGKKIEISINEKKVQATVVDECDSMHGCDKTHAFQPPCGYNMIDASKAVWEALGVPESASEYGYMNVVWRDVVN